jgi:hypothetical protein
LHEGHQIVDFAGAPGFRGKVAACDLDGVIKQRDGNAMNPWIADIPYQEAGPPPAFARWA